MNDTWRFEAIGTSWQIDLPDHDVEMLNALKSRIIERIRVFDQTYSRFRDDSLVTQMSYAAGDYELPPDARALLEVYINLYEETNGAFTPLVGQILSDAGYDASYSLMPRELTPASPLSSVLSYSYPVLTLSRPALLDFGAAGKGHLVDIVADLIEDISDGSYIVDAGGDMRVRAETPIRIGLEHPADASQVLGVATLTSGSICGSAGNRRAWGDFHHIIDPQKLVSPKHISAVWVTATEAIIADALTTALFFVEPQVLSTRYTFEYVIVYADESVAVSPGFQGELFIA